MKRAVRLVGALSIAALVVAGSGGAAAPNYILVSCPSMEKPALLGNWSENHVLVLSVAGAPKARSHILRTLPLRPRCDLAEFWAWGDKPRPTRASEANQHSWFYPARPGQRAVFAVTVAGISAPRIAPTRALEILARHGVPIRLSARS